MVRTSAISLVVAATLALPAGAPAAAPPRATLIVPGRSFGPVALLASRAGIESRLGPGVQVSALSASEPIVAYRTAALNVTYGTLGLRSVPGRPLPGRLAAIGVLPRVAIRIATASPRYRTASGIGVGSTERALRAAYATLVCPTSTLCRLPFGGARATLFELSGGRVRQVALVAGWSGGVSPDA